MLPYAPPYDWDAMIGFLAARAINGIEAVEGSARYHRSIALDGAQGVISVEPDGSGRGLRVTIRFPRIASLATIVRRVRRIFDLSADPLAVGEDLARDPLLAPLVAQRPGLRVPGAWDGFEVAVRAMLGQQITVTAASKLAAKLVTAYGEPLRPDYEGRLTHTFPPPERMAQADLRPLGMPVARAEALSSLAGAAAADPRLFNPTQTFGGRNHQAALAARHRRVDGAIHRDACLTRAGRLSSGRYRSDAGSNTIGRRAAQR